MKKIFQLALLLCISIGVSHAQEFNVKKDIIFKTIDNKALKLDLYTPTLQQEQPYHLLVWVHGGAWKRGSKNELPTKNPLLLKSILEQGYALAAIDYRLSSEAHFPAPVQDINDGINFLYKHAEQYHITLDNIGIMGRSAGGHLAGLIGASNGQNVSFYSQAKYHVSAIVSFFGPTDLLALGNKGNKPTTKRSSVSQFLGDIPSNIPDIAQQASTISYINKNTAPFIQLHGDLDKRVPLSQSVELKEKLDQNGVSNQLLIEKGVGHSAQIFDSEKYVPLVIDFLQQHFPAK